MAVPRKNALPECFDQAPRAVMLRSSSGMAVQRTVDHGPTLPAASFARARTHSVDPGRRRGVLRCAGVAASQVDQLPSLAPAGDDDRRCTVYVATPDPTSVACHATVGRCSDQRDRPVIRGARGAVVSPRRRTAMTESVVLFNDPTARILPSGCTSAAEPWVLPSRSTCPVALKVLSSWPDAVYRSTVSAKVLLVPTVTIFPSD